MEKILILIPTYNERENIEKLLNVLTTIVPSAHILVLDDNSPDGTWQYVESRKAENPNIKIHINDKKAGISKAYLRGFRFAVNNGYTKVIQMDADFSHDPEEIPAMLKLVDKNNLIIGSRYKTGVNVINWPMRRVLLSYFANYYVRFVTGTKIADCTGGFKCFSASILQAINFDKIISDGYIFQVEMNLIASKLGFSIKEHPIVFKDRENGYSKMASGIIVEALFKVLILRFKNYEKYRAKKDLEN